MALKTGPEIEPTKLPDHYLIDSISLAMIKLDDNYIKGHVNQCPLRKLKKASFKMKVSLFMLLKS